MTHRPQKAKTFLFNIPPPDRLRVIITRNDSIVEISFSLLPQWPPWVCACVCLFEKSENISFLVSFLYDIYSNTILYYCILYRTMDKCTRKINRTDNELFSYSVPTIHTLIIIQWMCTWTCWLCTMSRLAFQLREQCHLRLVAPTHAVYPRKPNFLAHNIIVLLELRLYYIFLVFALYTRS